jgi:asparagine synthetase B (glutamine-hydrolysing)
MCGIAGQFGWNVDRRLVAALIDAIAHRGPDQQAQFVEGDLYAGAACRLAVTDVNAAPQPCTSVDGTVTVSFNGEIYNYRDLAAALTARGAQFRNHSECEVLIAAYRLLGPRWFEFLEGMFAIALYDATVPRLLVARDRLGIKPLYLARHEQAVLYSSEIKAFFAAGVVTSEIDEIYCAHRRVFGFGPLGRTLFANVRSLDPGGVDSSILAACALGDKGASGELFTIRDSSETDDLVAARAVADSVRRPLIECVVPGASLGLLCEYLLAREEYDLLSLYTFVFSRLVSDRATVALCGQGADEVFAGYSFHRDVDGTIATFAQRWEALRASVPGHVSEVIDQRFDQLKSGDRRRAFHQFFLREQLVWFQLEPLDKCSMAHALEVRVPYLHERLVSFVAGLPVTQIFEGEKQLLREAFSDSRIPTLNRPKQFAGRWTIPRLHDDMIGICNRLGATMSASSERKSWMADSIAESVCLEALLVLLTQCAGKMPALTDLPDVEQLIRKGLLVRR